MKFYIERTIIEKGALEEPASSIVSHNTRDLTPENPWDSAHDLVRSRNDVVFAEPLMDYTEDIGTPESQMPVAIARERGGVDEPEPIFDNDWASPDPTSIWHLDEGFSQLAQACASVKDANPGQVIRVAHLDTGYDPNHSVKPNFRTDLQRNFVEENDDATDPNINTGLMANPGHGTGTSGILAGGNGKIPTGDIVAIGAAPFVEIVPLRIANAVVLIKTDAFVEAMNYVILLSENPETRIHVVTMSMGGVASKAWAEVINRAYEKGVLVVTAAGNNFGRATPRTLVYPARFNRVVAACGITFDKRPYSKRWGSQLSEMQGNYGPHELMRTAMTACTPNMPWARFGTADEVSLQGAGTSSATPQIAAAAAIYWKKFHHELIGLPGWQQVEIIRQALFRSASLEGIKGIEGDALDDGQKQFYFGRGYLRAADMLTNQPASLKAGLTAEDRDKVILPFWRVLFGTKSLFDEDPTPEQEMYQIEILQLIQISSRLQDILDNEERTIEDLNEAELKEFILEILKMEEASEHLKVFLRKSLP